MLPDSSKSFHFLPNASKYLRQTPDPARGGRKSHARAAGTKRGFRPALNRERPAEWSILRADLKMPARGKGAAMASERPVRVHLVPGLAPAGTMTGGVAVVIDVLRATTTIVHALAAGCTAVVPCAEVDEAKARAAALRPGKVRLGGERGGKPLPGFDLGNSPRDYTAKACKGATVVLSTTNGTRAILRAAEAERVLVAAFVNYSAMCELLRTDVLPVHIVCAGTEGEPSLEDTLLAGAIVDFLCDEQEVALNDAARLAWDAFENHGRVLLGALEAGTHGAKLRELGYDADIRAAADVDRFALVPELRRDPLRIERGTAGIIQSHWPR
jgi:2-phosphosulfolactate phosphatase